jgi:CopG family nickel-responsive transcriptional regulator
MANLVRFGIAMESELLERLDELVERRGAANRSEALRDLVRKELNQEAWAGGRVMVATITLVYDHHVRELVERLTEIQHDHGELIISSLHVHLDHAHCLEVIAVRGQAREIKAMADRIIGTKGVLTGHVVPAALPTTQKRR